MSTMREAGKQDWNSGNCTDHIKTGALQRIADACEQMAQNYGQLQDDRDRYKRWFQEEQERVRGRDNTIRGLRARITLLTRERTQSQKP